MFVRKSQTLLRVLVCDVSFFFQWAQTHAHAVQSASERALRASNYCTVDFLAAASYLEIQYRDLVTALRLRNQFFCQPF